MLRRKPTAIAITSEDLTAFEDARLQKLAREAANNGNNIGSQAQVQAQASYVQSSSANTKFDPSDELKPLPGDKARVVRSREERVGISRRA